MLFFNDNTNYADQIGVQKETCWKIGFHNKKTKSNETFKHFNKIHFGFIIFCLTLSHTNLKISIKPHFSLCCASIILDISSLVLLLSHISCLSNTLLHFHSFSFPFSFLKSHTIYSILSATILSTFTTTHCYPQSHHPSTVHIQTFYCVSPHF